MISRTVIAAVVAGVVSLFPVASMAAEQERSEVQTQMQEQEQIYGSQIMTPGEITEHRAKMRSLKTEAEREAYRREHHQMMQERAQEHGITLPDEPPASGGGMMGPGSGMGREGGMGSGGGGGMGMGSGGGRNR